MKRIGVVGSKDYKNKFYVFKVLEEVVDTKYDIIVSGHSPRNPIYNNGKIIYYDNVDLWAEDWANEKCDNEPIIHEAIIKNRNGFFKRNGLISNDSDEIRAFIPRGLYYSGTWNTINQFTKEKGLNILTLFIYDEFGNLWKFNEYPQWLKKRKI